MAFGASAGSVFLDVKPDMVGFQSAITSSTRSMRGSLGSVGKALGRTLALGIGAGLAGLAVIGKSAVEAAQEAAEVDAQTRAVLKSTGRAAGVTRKEIDKLATRISRYSAIEDEAVKSGANMLLTFTNIRNEAGKNNDIFTQSTEAITDMSVALDQDLKTSAIQLGKALNDPIAGVTALGRVGVKFTDEQKEQIKTLVESGRVLKAQEVILAELTKEFGGSAKAVGDTKPWDKMKNAIGEVLESIGKALLPTIGRLATRISRFVESDAFQKWLKDVTRWLKDNLPTALQTAREWAGKLQTGFQFLTEHGTTFANLAKGALATAIGVKLLGAFRLLRIEMMKNPWGLLAVAAASAVVLIIENWEAIKSATKAMVDFVVAQFERLTNIGGGFRNMLDPFARFGGGRAHGGPVTGGRPYVVGEQGPELIVPRQSGTVVPNNQLGGGMTQLNVSMDRHRVTTVVFETKRRNDILLGGR